MAFKLNQQDLEFVLKQIKIGEANANGADLTEIRLNPVTGEVLTDRDFYNDGVFIGGPGFPLVDANNDPIAYARAIPDPKTPFGIRTVDGTYNNLLAGRETWGAADRGMPRMLDGSYANDGDTDSFDPDGPGPALPITNGNYDNTAGGGSNVADADPRTISNLIVDMSANNPAALVAALTFAGNENPQAALQELMAARVAPDLVALQLAVEGANDALAMAVVGFSSADPTTIDAIQEAAEALTAAEAALSAGQEAPDAAEAFMAKAAELGLEFEANGSLIIPNVAPDEGLSAPFNAWMTFFGQFFDHGLDLITKGGNGTVYVPLQHDDPLYDAGLDGIAGNGDDGHANFMVLTRAMQNASGEHINTTTPWVDQNQTYTSHASHQVFLREYALDGAGRPVATGKLLDGNHTDGNNVTTKNGLPTWADVKAQALMLGVQLTDMDVLNLPWIRTDAYGNFIPDGNGFAQVITGLGFDGVPNTSDDAVVSQGSTGVAVNTFGVNALRTGHAFLDDIAHDAAPGTVWDHDGNPATLAIPVEADGGDVVGNAVATDSRGRKVAYDNELLDRHFITGDGRGNENIGLTAVHHVFHSEHNRQIDLQKRTILESGDRDFINDWLLTDIAENDPIPTSTAGLSWDGERLFQAARFSTEMQYQHLVFEEFGRKIQPNIDPFVFNSVTDIDPSIFSEFANVVYRFGHSMLTESMPRLNPDGTPMDYLNNGGDMGLIASFLNPVAFNNDGVLTAEQAAGAIVRGMTIERGNEIDEFVTGALRNSLLGLPLDLAAINIARSRDTGMPTLNEAREQLFAATGSTFLKPYESWVEFASNLKNPMSVINFIAAYGKHPLIEAETTLAGKRAVATELVFGVETNGDPSDIEDRVAFLNGTDAWNTGNDGLNAIDLWIGGLAEKKMPFGGFLGSTFNAVFEAQMEALQDGDRFYYLTRTQGQNFLNMLEENSFAKMIMANTDLASAGDDGIRGTDDDVVTRHIGVDSFATYDYVFEVNAPNQQDYDPEDDSVSGVDPTGNDPVLEALGFTKVLRDDPGTTEVETNYFRTFGGEHTAVGGTSGNDTIITDFGDDGIWGDAGDDRIESGAGVDLVSAGAGNDIITDSGDSGDFLKGEAGDDVIANSNGLDVIMGGSGKDAVFVGVDDTEVFGGEGDDFILGGDAVDLLMGNEGDDWIEGGGGFDTTAGDNSELFFNSAIKGHDVMFAGSEEHDFDAESGDDIMVQGESVMRNEGMFGFDWAVFKGVSFGGHADMRIPIFTTEQEDTLRNRFDTTEALSGWNHNDTLIGDDRVFGEIAPGDTVATTENIFFNDGLDQAGIDRIAGLNQIVSVAASGFFESGNILLGGGGSDNLRGNGGDDILDGDRWLNVRIRITESGEANTPENQIATIDSLKHVFADDFSIVAWRGKSLSQLMIDRVIEPDQLHIVREIVQDDGVGDTDVAYFNDAFLAADGTPNYTIVANPDGSFTVTHVNVTVGVIDPLTERQLVSDGVDTVRNVEVLQFTDRAISLIKPTLELNGFDPVTRTWGDNFSTAGSYANNTAGTTNTFNGAWTEALDNNTGAGLGSVRVTGGTLTFSQNNLDDASVTRSLNLAGSSSVEVAFSIADTGVGGNDNEELLFEFAADGVNFVTLRTFDGDNGGDITVQLPTDVPFSANAAIRFRANNTLDPFQNIFQPAESFSIDNVAINAVFPQPAASPSIDITTSYVENAAATPIASDPRVTDDGQTLVSARIVLTNAFAGDELVLPAALTGPGATISAVAQPVGSTIVVTLTGTASIAAYQAAIQSIGYRSTSDNPDPTPRNIETTVNDGFFDSNVARTTVNVQRVNDAPNAVIDNVVTNINGPILIPEWMMLRNDTDAEGSLTVTGATENDNAFTIAYNSTTRGVTATRSDADTTKDFTYTVSDGSLTDTADVDITWDTIGTISGTGDADIILGDGAASTFDGNGGNDLIIAGAGNDTIDGDAGDDEIHWNVGHGRDFINGGADTDTIRIVGNADSEAFVVYSRAAALSVGIGGLNPNTEIVITRNGTVITELDNIEEIVIDTGDGNDTVTTLGDFAPSSLAFNTITINGDGGNDTVDISGLQSAHRILFRSNGGNDTIVGNLRPQDVVELAPGQDISSYSVVDNGNGTKSFTNGTHSITFTGAVPPQFQNGPTTGGLAMDEEDLENLIGMVHDGMVRDSSGYGNNEANPNWGTAGQQFIRLTDAHYTDGAAGIRQTALTPREISNILSNQDNDGNGVEESIPNAFGGTSLLTFFGQYFDHGLDFVAKGQPGSVYIGDVGATPVNAPRANIVPGTGVDGIPAQYINEASPYVDQNQAYGSHDAITDLLRRWEIGSNGEAKQTAYLLTGDIDGSGHALLPTLSHIRDNYRIMTDGGELTSADIGNYDGSGQPLLIDFIPKFVLLEDGSPSEQLDLDQIGHYFVTGDGRANENVMLTSIHTIWARNHNFWVDRLKTETDGAWTEAEYFEAARMMNIAEYQRVVFTEFATAMAGGFDNDDEHGFEGYDPTVDASISVEFAQAAYRFGHSMLNETVSYVDENGVLQQKSLVQVFLRPDQVDALGIDGLLGGSVQTQHQAIDVDVVNALRNQLVGRPLDLAALNIFRGRDMGVAPFNSVREQLYEKTGLPSLRPYSGWSDFAQRNSLPAALIAKLKEAYPDGFETMDLWIGGLLEKPAAGQLGSTFGYIFLEQLDRLQHGDRFYYLEIFDDSLFTEGNDVTFADIIERNSGLSGLPENVFDTNGSNAPGDDDDSIFDEDGDVEDEDGDDPVGNGDDEDDVDEDEDDDTDEDDEDEDDEDQDDEDDEDVVTSPPGDDEEDTDPPPIDEDNTDMPASPTGFGTPNRDILIGTAGRDHLIGFEGSDVMIGYAGADLLFAGDGADYLAGWEGNDSLFGDAGDDNVIGGDDDDFIEGNDGDDRLFGDRGNDLITGGAGSDTVVGGAGNDTLVALKGDGNDSYFGDEATGGTGIDTLDMGSITANVMVDLGSGLNGSGLAISSDTGTDLLWGIENVKTGSGNDTITASNAVNVIDAGGGSDTFRFKTIEAVNGDTIVGFEQRDKIDLSAIDANSGSFGDQGFSLVNGNPITSVGQLAVSTENRADGDYTVIEGNTGGSNAPEFKLSLKGDHALTQDNFIF